MRSYWALVALATLAAWRPCPGVRADGAFRCPACTPERISRCPTAPPTSECAELVREPGCGCCPACALGEDAPCGVYTARCGSGLRCAPRGGTERPLHELIEGLGRCVRVGDGEGPTAEADTAGAERGDLGHHDEVEESHEAWARPPSVHTSYGGRARPPPLPPLQAGRPAPVVSAKDEAVDRNNHKEKENARFVSRPNVIKEEMPVKPARGKHGRSPCELQLEQVVMRLGMKQLTDRDTSLEGLYIPNCDRGGLFNSKQCKPAENGQRGECWCVDPTTGRHVAGTPTKRGDPECQRFLKPPRAGRDDASGGAVAKTKPPPPPE